MIKIKYPSKVFISDTSRLKLIFQTLVMTKESLGLFGAVPQEVQYTSFQTLQKGTTPQKHNFSTVFCEQESIVQTQVLL